ncbi:hypothetical protein CONCODRAFT_13871, partial [Conidiobolus coronatus NRRL 28638]
MASGESEYASKLLNPKSSSKGFGMMACEHSKDLRPEPDFCYKLEFNDDVRYIDTRTSRRARLQDQVSELKHVSECVRMKEKKGHGLNGCSYCLKESGYVACRFDELCGAMCFACFKRSRAKNRGAAIASAVGLLSATQFKDAWYRKLLIDAECASCHIYSPALDARLKNTSGRPVESLDATNIDACADYYLWIDKKKHLSNLPLPVPKGFDIIVWCGCCQAIVLRTKTCGMHQIVESKRCMHINKSVLIRCEIIDASLPPSTAKEENYDYEYEVQRVARYNFPELYEACCGEPGRYVDTPFRLEDHNSEDLREHMDGISHGEQTSASPRISQFALEKKAACVASAQSNMLVGSNGSAFWSNIVLDSDGTRACEAMSYVTRVWCDGVPDEVSDAILRSLVVQLTAGAFCEFTPECIAHGNKGCCELDLAKDPDGYGRNSCNEDSPTRGGVDSHPLIPGPSESASAWVPKMMSMSELAACKAITIAARTVNLYSLWRKYVGLIGSADDLKKIFSQADDAIVIQCVTRLATLMSVGSAVPEDENIAGLHGLVVSTGLCSCSMVGSPMMAGKTVGCVGSACINFACIDAECLTGASRCIIVARIVSEYALWPSALRAIQIALDGLSTGVSKGHAKSWQLE